MSAPESIPTPDFDEDFLQAIARWKKQHKIKEDDLVLLLLDLFRIHQTHWDEIRRRQMPSLDEFRTEIATLTETAKILKQRASDEIGGVSRPTGIIAAFAAALAGFLIGRFL